MVLSETGEDEMVSCPHCGYSANVEKAQFAKAVIAVSRSSDSERSEEEGEAKQSLPLEEIATPEQKTIEEVANFLGVPSSQTLKAVFYIADKEFIFVVIRGDLEVNETKLRNTLKCNELRIATQSEVAEAGIVAGFASPIGIKGIKVVADDSITLGSNFIAGANKPGYHFKNVNYPRDFQVDTLADIALAHQGDKCPECGGKLSSARGIEVGHIFKLGTFISEKLGASFLDQDGVSRPAVMGCYGIGLGRLLAAIVEQSHDDNGIIWPISVAPYQVYLCPLHLDNPAVTSAAEKVYQELETAGIEVLFDDRDESPGVKFNDADLLGIPLRLTISPRTLQNQSIETKWRTEKETQLLPLENFAAQVNKLLKEKLAY
jgi:prolyl-tRNA synthetase